MHTHNQIDTILSTIEILKRLANDSKNIDLITELDRYETRVQSIINANYTTDHLQKSYMNPIEESMSQLFLAQFAINKYQTQK